MNREAIYDAEIAPLMDRIISICREHDIPIVATFQLSATDDPLMCTTVIVPDWSDVVIKQIGLYLDGEVEAAMAY